MLKRNLSAAEASMAISMIQTAATQVDVAEHFKVSQTVISRLENRYNKIGNVAERVKTRRIRVITRILKTVVLINNLCM